MAEQTEKPATVLRYVGQGFLPGVPARDLTTDDLAALAEADAPKGRDRKTLLKSGLYAPVETPAKEH